MPLTAQAAVAQRTDFKSSLPLSIGKFDAERDPVECSLDGEKFMYKQFSIRDSSGRCIGEISYGTSDCIGVRDLAAARDLADRVVLATNAFGALVEYFNASQLFLAVINAPSQTLVEEREATVRHETAARGAMRALTGKYADDGAA